VVRPPFARRSKPDDGRVTPRLRDMAPGEPWGVDSRCKLLQPAISSEGNRSFSP
jgi:hypothetical protein